MLVLAIESATDLVGAAIGDDHGVVAEAVTLGRRRHAECLVPIVRHVLSQAGVTLHQLAVIAVDIGPGLFTGLRVGVATANGLAAGLGCPVIGVQSVDVLAESTSGSVLSVVDARRGQVFAASYHDGVPVEPAALLDPVDVAALVTATPTVAVGDGAARYRQILEAVPGVVVGGPASRHPRPASLEQVARRRVAADASAAGLGPVLPTYLRHADVRVGWAQRPAVSGGPGAST